MADKYEITKFKLEDGSEILVEAISTNKDNKRELLTASGETAKTAVKTFNETIETIKDVAEATINSIKKIAVPPKEITLEIGLKLSSEIGAIIAKASAEGNIKVSLKWVSTQ